MAMTNRQAADVLFNVATILEMAEDSPYRIRAYRRAARLLMRQDGHLHVTESGELDVPGLSVQLRRKLGALAKAGRFERPGYQVIDQ